MSIQLRPYQEIDVQKTRARKKILIRHEPGVGKMVIGSRAVLGLGDDRYDATPALVACPSHVVPDWEEHLRAEYPEAKITVAAELSPTEKREALAEPSDFWIVNHTMLAIPTKAAQANPVRSRNYYPMPKARSFILDESHYPNMGRKARAWVGARKAADDVKSDGLVVLMSATPIKKTSDGLWAQLRLVDKTLTSYWRFVNQHCIVVEGIYGAEIKGSRPSMARELEKRSIYRKYSDPEVGLFIPNVLPRDSRVTLTDQTMKNYTRLKKELRDEENNPVFSAGAAVAKLRHMVAIDPNKLARIKELTADLDQFVIFTWYRETAYRLAEELGAVAVTGAIQGVERNALAKKSPKLVANIAALASSVDLSHHRHVFFYEECYEPGTQENALARIKRWRKGGGDEPVQLRYVYGVGTIDERIHNLAKSRLADSLSVTDRRLIREELHS